MVGYYFGRMIEWLVDTFGYTTVIKAKDFILCLAGVFIGSLIHALLSGNVIRKLDRYEKLTDKMIFVSMNAEEGETHFVNPHNFAEAVQAWLYLIYMPIFRIKRFTWRDQRRTRRVLAIIYILGIVFIILAVIFIGNPILNPGE